MELRETGEVFAMKAMEKSMMLSRNKVHSHTADQIQRLGTGLVASNI